MIMVYNIFFERDGEEKWIQLGLINEDQALTLASSFPSITEITNWLGSEIYKRKTVH